MFKWKIAFLAIVGFMGSLEIKAQGTDPPGAKYQWKIAEESTDWLLLFQGDSMVGWWNKNKKEYRPMVRLPDGKNGWGNPMDPPIPPNQPNENFGVGTSQEPQKREYFSTNQGEISKETAAKMIGDKLPTHQSNLRVSIFGNTEKGDRIKAEVEADPALKDRVSFWNVPADHWSTKDRKGNQLYPAIGDPVIIAQSPSGKVLTYQKDWNGVQSVGAIREAFKRMNWSKVPDLRQGGSSGGLEILVLLAAVAGIFFLLTYKKGNKWTRQASRPAYGRLSRPSLAPR